MFSRLLGWYTVYTFWGLLLPNGVLPGSKFALRPSHAFSYIGIVTARHSSSVRQPNFAVWLRGIFARQDGHPVRHWVVELTSFKLYFLISCVS